MSGDVLRRPLRYLSVRGISGGLALYMSTPLTQWTIDLKTQTELVHSRLVVLKRGVSKAQILYSHHSVDNQ